MHILRSTYPGPRRHCRCSKMSMVVPDTRSPERYMHTLHTKCLTSPTSLYFYYCYWNKTALVSLSVTVL